MGADEAACNGRDHYERNKGEVNGPKRTARGREHELGKLAEEDDGKTVDRALLGAKRKSRLSAATLSGPPPMPRKTASAPSRNPTTKMVTGLVSFQLSIWSYLRPKTAASTPASTALTRWLSKEPVSAEKTLSSAMPPRSEPAETENTIFLSNSNPARSCLVKLTQHITKTATLL